MSRRARAIVAVAVLWPPFTFWLQAQWDVDPWKLMSFGMYATPPRRPRDLSVELSVRRSGAWERADLAVDAFQGRRQALGELASPQPLLDALMAQPGVSGARVVLRFERLDAHTARLTEQVRVYER